jgi:hypothetical protein
VSAKEGKNINDLFSTVAERLLNEGKVNKRSDDGKLKNKKKKKSGCC